MEQPSEQTVTVAERGQPESGEGKDEKTTWLSRVTGLFFAILGFAPLIVGFLISDFRIASTVALSLALFNFTISYFSYRAGRTRTWPKVLDCIFLSLFAVLTALTWADQKRDDVYKYWSSVIINGGMILGMVISWLCGHPFVTDYMQDSLDIDKEGLSHPMVRHHIKIMTSIWLIIFVLMEASCLVGAIRSLYPPEPSQDFVQAFSQPGYIQFIILGFGSVFNIVYKKYNQRPQAKTDVANKYDKEIQEWMMLHPHHKFSKQYRERKEREAVLLLEEH